MVLPLLGAERVRGALLVARSHHRRPFTAADMDAAATFANQASVALELADARRDQQKVLLLEDRARIARDLHDHVIQELFAAGLAIQTTASHIGGVDQAALEKAVDYIDGAIKQIRVSIFHLRPSAEGLRSAVMEVVNGARASLGFDPQLAFEGPVDTVTIEDLINDVTAVVREALSNVARHAGATRVEVLVRARGDDISLRVRDNGRGIGQVERSSGLANIRRRADDRRGSMLLGSGEDGTGTVLEWRIPLG
jgi:signal transduction histidine kinase